jgi:hypothetical protein
VLIVCGAESTDALDALAAGLTHFPVYATDPTLTFKIGGNAHKNYVAAGCDKVPSIVTQWQNNACRSPLIAGRVEVPLRALEEALVNALDTIGYRTEYQGIYNSEPLWVRPPVAVNETAIQYESSGGEADSGGDSNPAPLAADDVARGRSDEVEQPLVGDEAEAPQAGITQDTPAGVTRSLRSSGKSPGVALAAQGQADLRKLATA